MVKKDELVLKSLVKKYGMGEILEPILKDGFNYCNDYSLLSILKSIRTLDNHHNDILRIAIKAIEDKDSSLYLITDKIKSQSEYNLERKVDDMYDEHMRKSRRGDD